MSDSGSDNNEESFTEHEDKETQLGYGRGRVPLYVAVVWVIFIFSYLAIMTFLALPDLRAWSSR